MDVLEDPAFTVVPAPPAASGVAWLRSQVARFSEGPAHARRRSLTMRLVAGIDLARLRRPGAPVANLAAALGLPRDRRVVAHIAAVARSYQPHSEQSPEADDAVARLVEAFGGAWNELTAARIGLLVQAHDATNAMIAGQSPPVPKTRRIGPSGEEVLVDLTETPFGAGPHACPGRDQALAMVEGALAFKRLHAGPEPLVLPNAWDVASAAALVAAGFAAIGTTSLGVAAAHGLVDGAGTAYEETLALARRLAGLPVPVSVDVEAGFGAVPEELAAELSALGIAGLNIEDGRGGSLAGAKSQAALVQRLKRGAPELFVNARVDTHWLGVARDETLDRARRYVDAGADGIFIPGLTEPAEIERIASALAVPLNVLAQLPIDRLAQLGVRRVSTGSLLFRVALDAALSAAERVRRGERVHTHLSYSDVQRLAD
jgi:2-methylisocitrate lyase-like PEP mutase family enzyme